MSGEGRGRRRQGDREDTGPNPDPDKVRDVRSRGSGGVSGGPREGGRQETLHNPLGETVTPRPQPPWPSPLDKRTHFGGRSKRDVPGPRVKVWDGDGP